MSQFRSNFTTIPHIMPSPPSIPWNSEAMPWTISTPYPRVMEFNATPIQLPNQYSLNRTLAGTNINIYKRKSDIPLPMPSKQFITEEKMAAHLNGLHISPDYVSHDADLNVEGTVTDDVKKAQQQQQNSAFSDYSMDSDNDYMIPLTAKDLEEKLKNASKITICDEIKKLSQGDTILPKALLSRIEKPCTALVLWQPPQKLKDLIVHKNENTENANDDYEAIDEDQQNNNSSLVDYNYGMETDM